MGHSIQQRDNGMELVRIISMYMVVILHVLGSGGILAELQFGSIRFGCIWFLELASACACNSFALLSGYVGVTAKKYYYSNLAIMWLQIVFVSVVITAIASIAGRSPVTSADWLETVTPIINGPYWYVDAYFGMFLFVPLMNRGANSFTKNQFRLFIFAAFVAFSLVESLAPSSVFKLTKGYHCLWLICLYMIGAYMKKYDGFSLKKINAALLFLSSVIVSLVIKYGLEHLIYSGQDTDPKTLELLKLYDGKLMDYSSPFILLAGIAVICFCRNVKPGKIMTRFITIFAPASFGVYIIHRNPIIWRDCIEKCFADYAHSSGLIMIMQIIGTVTAIYVLCSFFEMIRIRLFGALKIKQRLRAFEDRHLGRIWNDQL